MAKYDVTYSCGHTREVSLLGRVRERERRLEYLSGCLCPDCQAAQQASYNDVFESEYAGLATLVGSEKQIEWARTRRRHLINKYEETVDQMIKSGRCTEKWKAQELEWQNVFASQKSAQWWIDCVDLINEGKAYFKVGGSDVKKNEYDLSLGNPAVVVPENRGR